jgi:hypothetical protein
VPHNPPDPLVVLDARVDDEKIRELLALQAEHPELDFKRMLDLSIKRDEVELAKDVGAMQVKGSYILIAADDHGTLTGEMDGTDPRQWDEANLRQKMLRYLPEGLSLRTRVATISGPDGVAHQVVVIYVQRSPRGCAIFTATGQYEDAGGRPVVVFREGEIFWRDGTSSTRISPAGLEEIIEDRIRDAKGAWMQEQVEIRAREREDLQRTYAGRSRASEPLGSVSLDLSIGDLTATVLEMARLKDEIGVQHFLVQAAARARELIARGEVGVELGDTLDKLTCVAATLMTYRQSAWLELTVQTLSDIYSMAATADDVRRFALNTQISPEEKAPRIWLEIIERVYALGSLAVRQERWECVRLLATQLPTSLTRDGYETNWLRHALTASSRARQFNREQDGRTIEVSLVSLANTMNQKLTCLRPDGLSPDDDALLTSVCQFDVLANLACIDDAGSLDSKVFYTNFARFDERRVAPIVERLLRDDTMRASIFRRPDAELATALNEVGRRAAQEGARYSGFWGWDRTAVGEFIQQNLPQQQT